jgi:hypothetical protein
MYPLAFATGSKGNSDVIHKTLRSPNFWLPFLF